MAEHGEFIIPNFHVILVHFPLGLLTIGVTIELFAFLWRRSTARAAARWMILIGALAMVPAALTGIYALRDVATQGLGADAGSMSWRDVVASSQLDGLANGGADDHSAWHTLVRHTQLQSAASVLALVAVVTWLAASDVLRKRLHFIWLVILCGAVGLASSGAWFAGEAVYRYSAGVGDASEKPTAPAPPVAKFAAPSTRKDVILNRPPVARAGSATRPATVASVVMPTPPATAPAEEDEMVGQLNALASRYAPPLQTHILFAGFSVAIALASLGASIRRLSKPAIVTEKSQRQLVDNLAAALEARPAKRSGSLLDEPAPAAKPTFALSDVRPAASTTLGTGLARGHRTDPVFTGRETEAANAGAEPAPSAGATEPVVRWWILASATALLAALFGTWFLLIDSDLPLRGLWGLIASGDGNLRRLVHVITGVSIVALPLCLGLLVRYAPKKRILFAACSALLLAAVTVQAWIGILMLYDTAAGPVTGFTAISK